ncbi:MAG: TrkA family potassium uptake protein [Planctomycetes bacterium]|nr:TrkA family potassium uptake protein [Planctomycetota bacterium]
MKVAVVGMSLFGRSFAVELARCGAEVIAIDVKLERVESVRDEVTLAVCLDATDERALRSQGVHEVDVLVASIGNDFEANQLLVMLGKELGIGRILARAPSPRHASILKKLGADEVILPEVEAAERAARGLLERRGP